jgi:predicted CoA-binding protein
VGLSSDPGRASYGVSRHMQGYEIAPVNPNEVIALGEKPYVSLEEVSGPIEIVDIFRRPEFVPDVVDAAMRKLFGCIWGPA